MSARSQLRRRCWRACGVGSVAALIGGVAWWFQLGTTISYDLPFAFADRPPTNVVILLMDEQSHDALKETYGVPWRVSHHAELLRRLKEDGSGPVVFDVFFSPQGEAAEDAAFARAITDHGGVILAADLSPVAQPGFVGPGVARPPRPPLRSAALAWGISEVTRETDGAVRRHPPERELYPSLACVAARAIQGQAEDEPPSLLPENRWLRYYGRTAMTNLSYYSALDRTPGYFKDKIVFVGGKPRTQFVAEESDEYRSPYTFWSGALISGVELHAIMLLNLLQRDWLARARPIPELIGIVVAGFLVGFSLRLLKPTAAALAGIAIALVISAVGVLLTLKVGIWFPWATLSGIVVPAAWLCSLAAYKQEVRRVPSEGAYDETVPMLPLDAETAEVRIPDYSLLKLIGHGAYGEVWLGRNRVGLHHAVKIVYRKRFNEVTPYEREFRGIRKYMPISLTHPGLVRLLYVGRNDSLGFFYYIMELGDDENTGQEIDIEKYVPRNLAKDLQKRDHLPVQECVSMAIALSESLEFLHKKGLMHRDIKPANVIFIDGIPKLADIGLVAEISRTGGTDGSYIGTEGYMAPEGPSKPTSDIYSFGKMLYEASMGLDRRQFPELPDWMNEQADIADLMALNTLILKCCDKNPRRRFQSASELQAALLALERRISARQPA